MKKFSIYIEFEGGKYFQFQSDDNPLELLSIEVNGAEIIMTREQYGVNLARVVRMEVVEIGKGKIGEMLV